MTELLTRPSTSAAAEDTAGPSVWWRGTLAAAWAVAVGLASLVVVVLVVWAADSRASSGATAATRTALQLWLVAHRVPLSVPGGSVAIPPLLVTLGLAFLVARAGAVLARGQGVVDAAGVGVVALAVGLPYAGFATFVAAASGAGSVRPAPMAALFGGLLLGLAAAAWGAARGTVGLRALVADSRPALRVSLTGAAAALAGLATGGLLLLLVSLAVHGAALTHALEALGGGGVGVTGLVLLDLALLPNALACVLGYVAGPGFSIGAGTSVTLTGAHLGPMPALPLIVSVPRGPASLPAEVIAVAVLVGAGAWAGRSVARADLPLRPSMGYAALAAALTGLLVGALVAVAGGPAGPGAMATVGASGWQVGLCTAAEVAVVACGTVGALTFRRGR